MTAPADWLTGERPPLPFREATPLYDKAVAASRRLMGDMEERERTATLYRIEDLTRVLEPVWPAVAPSEDGTVPAMPRVKPRRWSRKWWAENWTAARIVGAGASVLVFAAIGAGWFQ